METVSRLALSPRAKKLFHEIAESHNKERKRQTESREAWKNLQVKYLNGFLDTLIHIAGPDWRQHTDDLEQNFAIAKGLAEAELQRYDDKFKQTTFDSYCSIIQKSLFFGDGENCRPWAEAKSTHNVVYQEAWNNLKKPENKNDDGTYLKGHLSFYDAMSDELGRVLQTRRAFEAKHAAYAAQADVGNIPVPSLKNKDGSDKNDGDWCQEVVFMFKRVVTHPTVKPILQSKSKYAKCLREMLAIAEKYISE